jgi:hypothetical protein
MSLFNSIIHRQNHGNAIAFMGLLQNHSNFPAVMPCPFCGQFALYAYDDIPREDLWFNCDGCLAHGNIITFAAQIWKTSLDDALDRFAEEKLCNRNVGGREYVKNSAKYAAVLKCAQNFWAAASTQLWSLDSSWITHKLRDLGVSRDIACDGLVGATAGKQIRQMYNATKQVMPQKLYLRAPMLIFPHYDLPGRICGFMLVHEKNIDNRNHAFLSLVSHRRAKPNAGYYLLNTALLPPHKILKTSHFVVDDPLWVLRAQTTQLRHGLPLLPISSGYVGPEAASLGGTWLSMPSCKRFFYSESITPELISQAAGGRGYVCPAQSEYTLNAVTPLRTIRRLAVICRAAVTWQTALADVCANLNTVAAKTFLTQLTISRERVNQFLTTRKPLPHNEINDVLNQMLPRREVAGAFMPQNDAIVREDGWFSPRNIPILNCCPVIEKIIYADNGKKYYSGYVKKNNLCVPFFVPANDIDRKKFINFISALMAKHGELVIAAHNNVNLLSMTLKLHKPQILNVRTALGWDSELRLFNLGDYSLDNAGTVVPQNCPEVPRLQSFNFPQPSAVAPNSINALLTPTHENAFVWAVTAAVLAQLIAPVVDADASSVAVLADNFAIAAAVGEVAGGEIHQIDRHVIGGRSIANALRATSTPQFIEVNSIARVTRAGIVIKCPNTSGFISMPAACLPGALSYGWTAISMPSTKITKQDYAAISYVIPAYIQRTLQQRVRLPGSGPQLVTAILRDLHAWLEPIYGKTFNLAAALEIIQLPTAAHIALMRQLNAAILDDKIAVLPKPRYKTQRANYVLREKTHWWLNKKAIQDYMKINGVVPNWRALINCFTQQGVFLGETVVQNMTGLCIAKDWCDAFWSDYGESAAKHAG